MDRFAPVAAVLALAPYCWAFTGAADCTTAGGGGTGFTERDLGKLRAADEPLVVETPPTTGDSTVPEPGARSVRPACFASVTFAEWLMTAGFATPRSRGWCRVGPRMTCGASRWAEGRGRPFDVICAQQLPPGVDHAQIHHDAAPDRPEA